MNNHTGESNPGGCENSTAHTLYEFRIRLKTPVLWGQKNAHLDRMSFVKHAPLALLYAFDISAFAFFSAYVVA